MKCLVIKLLLLLSFTILASSLRSKSKLKIKSRSKNRKSAVANKNSSSKKDGPINWDNLSYDAALESLLKNERMGFIQNTDNGGDVLENQYKNTNFIEKITSRNSSSAGNKKSKTFRAVGPLLDSTVSPIGKKYSKIYRIENRRKINSGYYGKSRLTR